MPSSPRKTPPASLKSTAPRLTASANVGQTSPSVHPQSMPTLIVLVLLTLALPLTAVGESFDERLADANERLRSGDTQGALSAYRDLQVEDPESDLLYYNMGCAQYKQARNMAGAEFMDEAAQAYAAANEALEKASWGGTPTLRKNAQYNLANTAAQVAKLSATPGNEQEAQKAFEECIQRYEEFLKRHPDHEAARSNLDHMRYYLKKMLQKPPPQENEQNEQQEQQSQENQDQQSNDQQQPQQGQDQQQDEQQEQEHDQEQQQQQSSEQQESEEQEQQQQASANQQDQQQQEGAAEEESEPKDRQTVEAILQSLEDLDQREQYDLREGEIDSHLRKEWW